MVKDNDKQMIERLSRMWSYINIHAIYKPDGYGPFGDCFCAAVDLFEEGMTFKVYFRENKDGSVKVQHVERCFWG